MRNDVAKIITQYPNKTELVKKKQEFFSEKKSLTRTEFYAAYSSKLDVKFVFEFDPDDYNSCIVKVNNKRYYPTHVEYDGEEFTIARTYQKDMTSIEVVVR